MPLPTPRVCSAARRRGTAAAGLLLSLVVSAPAVAQPIASGATATLDPAAYAAALHDLSERARLTEPATLMDLERHTPAGWRVDAGGQVIEVPGVWLQRTIREAAQSPDDWPHTRARILESLAAAERDARELAAAQPASSADARARLEEVMARPEFAQISRETAIARLQMRLIEWFRRWWTRIGGDRLPVRSTATLFAWAASIAAFAVLAGWVIHILRRSNRERAPGDAPAPRGVSAEAWARQAAAAQDFREAVRCAWRALVSRYDEEGIWRADAARTPREYVRLLPRNHRRRPVAEDVARRFEEIWFGGRPATDDDRGAMLRRLRELGCLPAE